MKTTAETQRTQSSAEEERGENIRSHFLGCFTFRVTSGGDHTESENAICRGG